MSVILSVVTVCFNSSKTIEQTILSVITQKVDGIEYIIIDGGSNDGTLEIIENYRSDIDVFVTEKDYGIADAFNKGVHRSSGRYVCFLNADDYYESNILFDVLELLKLGDKDLVYGKTQRVSVSDKIGAKESSRHLELALPFSHCSSFLKRSYFDRYGYFNVAIDVAMDVELLLRGYQQIRKGYVDKVIANQRDGGVSDRNRKKGYYQYFLSYSMYIGFWKGLRGYFYKILIFYFRKVIKK